MEVFKGFLRKPTGDSYTSRASAAGVGQLLISLHVFVFMAGIKRMVSVRWGCGACKWGFPGLFSRAQCMVCMVS